MIKQTIMGDIDFLFDIIFVVVGSEMHEKSQYLFNFIKIMLQIFGDLIPLAFHHFEKCHFSHIS